MRLQLNPRPRRCHNACTHSLINLLAAMAVMYFADQGALLKNLTPNAVISPQQLGPEKLLTPYLPRPNLTQAYPLGPPVTAARTLDPFVRLGLDPLDTSPMNPWLRAEYCTSMGKIKSRGKTGLQRGSQRRMGKAVRRARVSAWDRESLGLAISSCQCQCQDGT